MPALREWPLNSSPRPAVRAAALIFREIWLAYSPKTLAPGSIRLLGPDGQQGLHGRRAQVETDPTAAWSVFDLTTCSRLEPSSWTSTSPPERPPPRSAGAGRSASPAGAPGPPGHPPRSGPRSSCACACQEAASIRASSGRTKRSSSSAPVVIVLQGPGPPPARISRGNSWPSVSSPSAGRPA